MEGSYSSLTHFELRIRLGMQLTRTLMIVHFPRVAFQLDWRGGTMGPPPRLLFQASSIWSKLHIGLELLSLHKPSARQGCHLPWGAKNTAQHMT
jgi:hypothetical protein